MHLFSPLTLGNIRLPNRIVMSAFPSGRASSDGIANAALIALYEACAQAGAGTIVLETAWPLRPKNRSPHLGLYDELFLPALSACIDRIHRNGAAVLMMIDQPIDISALSEADLRSLRNAWISAASWACNAGADGVMLSCADNGPFHQLISPLQNRRSDDYGGNLEKRTRLLFETTERLSIRFGNKMLIGLRLLVEEFTPGGLTLQDARVIARRLTGSGVQLIEAFARAESDTPMAQFPGWQIPLAESLRTLVDVPLMVGGMMGDLILANSVIQDRSADLIALGDTLVEQPDWPIQARAQLNIR